jgi:hypothetical protein
LRARFSGSKQPGKAGQRQQRPRPHLNTASNPR